MLNLSIVPLLVSIPFVGQAAISDPFIYDTQFISMPVITMASYGTRQTAVRRGDAPILQTSVYTRFAEPLISADLSQFGFSSFATTSGTWRGYGAPHYPSYFYNFGPIRITSDIRDGVYTIPIVATNAVGNIAIATTSLVVDNVPPIISLSSITFSNSTTSPRAGDYMYLSGSSSGTGSILKVMGLLEGLFDANGNPLLWYSRFTGDTISYNSKPLNDAIASSSDGTFTNVPIKLYESDDPGQIARATSFRVRITAYDEAGHTVSTSLTVLVPKSTMPDPCANGGCVSNVLFLPGLEASRLYRPDYDEGTDQLWEPNTESDTEDLFLVEDGTSVRSDVYTKEVIDEIKVLPLGQKNIYKSFLNDLFKWKNTDKIITDYAVAPYDWRLSLDDILNYGNQFPDGRIYYSGNLRATSSPYIMQELRRLAKNSKTGKVTIVAHSNGGLVTKALVQKLGDAEAKKLIDKIIFVAVPQAGTPQAIGAILHGYDQGLPFDMTPLVLTPETARALAKNMPSAYNLLPSASYFTQVDTPVVTFDNSDILAQFRARYGTEIHSGELLRNFVTDTWRLASSSPRDLLYPSVGNATLFAKAEAVHTFGDTWAPPQGISLHEIAGWGEDTLATIEYTEGKKSYCSRPQDIHSCVRVPAIIYSPKEVIDGDGTVVVPSALWSTASTTKKYWVNLRKYDELKYGNVERNHADILEIPSLRTLVQNILTNSTSTTPFEFISTTQPIPESSDNRERLRFVLHSPLNLSATDSLGNSVSSVTSTISGSRFKRYGEVQVLTVPKNIPITLSLDGYATGSFTLDMQEIDGSNTVIASSSFSAIPSTESTKATMTFADGTLQNASPLLLDYDGDTEIDFSLASKIGETVVFDTTPPEAILTFDPVAQKLKIIGTDNISDTTVVNTATSSTIIDEAGNTLQIVFKKFKQEGKQIKLEIQELRYNGTLVSNTEKITLHYEWSVDKTGALKELEEKASIGALKVSGHYDAKKNTTKIDGKVEKEVRTGLVVFRISTDNGKFNIDY